MWRYPRPLFVLFDLGPRSAFLGVVWGGERGFAYLGLDKVTDADLGHDGDGDGVDDLTDHSGVRHTSNTTY